MALKGEANALVAAGGYEEALPAYQSALDALGVASDPLISQSSACDRSTRIRKSHELCLNALFAAGEYEEALPA